MRCSSSCFASTVRFSFIYLLCVCCLVLLTRVSPLTLTIAASRTALLFPPGERNKKSMILYGNFDVFLVNFSFISFLLLQLLSFLRTNLWYCLELFGLLALFSLIQMLLHFLARFPFLFAMHARLCVCVCV